VQRHGPLDLCGAVSAGANSPKRSGGFEAKYRYKVAPRRVQIVLALEVTTSWWPTNLTDRDTQAYPRDEHRQPAVGSATDPRRVAFRQLLACIVKDGMRAGDIVDRTRADAGDRHVQFDDNGSCQ
jgi:hypothetical protein